MKIWLLTSWIEFVPLFRLLNQFDHEYIIFFDWDYWPWGDKDFETVLKRVEYWINYLISKVDKIILPPLWEIFFLSQNKFEDKIFPLFLNYCLYCLNWSLVWKIWFVWDWLDKNYFQKLFPFVKEKYTLNERQKNTKKFNKKFPVWIKEVPMWKYYLIQFSFRDRMVRKTIKVDLRYFKDAAVDTLIFLNWWYLAYDKMIRNWLNFKKIRYHSLFKMYEKRLKLKNENIGWKIEEENYKFLKSIFSLFEEKQTCYNIKIYYTWHLEFLLRQKRLIYLLRRWKQTDLDTIKIS